MYISLRSFHGVKYALLHNDVIDDPTAKLQ